MIQTFMKVELLQIESSKKEICQSSNIKVGANNRQYRFLSDQLKKVEKQSHVCGDKSFSTFEFLNKDSLIFIGCQNLEVFLYKNESQDAHLGYLKIPLNQLIGFPKVRHIVHARCGWIDRKTLLLANNMGQSAIIKLAITFFHHFEALLNIHFIDAQLLRDTEAVSKMDPYVICKIDDNIKKTKVHDEGGKTPKWDQIIEFKLNSLSQAISLEVKDKDLTSDDIVGSAIISTKSQNIFVTSQKPQNHSIDIFYKKKKAGTINITTHFLIEKM